MLAVAALPLEDEMTGWSSFLAWSRRAAFILPALSLSMMLGAQPGVDGMRERMREMRRDNAETPHLTLIRTVWQPADGELSLVSNWRDVSEEDDAWWAPRIDHARLERALDLLRSEGRGGTIWLQGRGAHRIGRDAYVVLIMREPVREPVELPLPDTAEPVLFVQMEDGFHVLPAGIPVLDQTLRIEPCRGGGCRNSYGVELAPVVLDSGESVPGGRAGGGLTFKKYRDASEPPPGAEPKATGRNPSHADPQDSP